VTVRAADGSVVYRKTRPIGGVTDLGQAALTAGSSYTLTFSDLAFPTALAQAGNGALVVQDDTVAASLAVPGTPQPFTAVAGGNYEVFAIAAPDTTAGVGTYSVQVTPQTGAAILSTARAVTVPGNAMTAYSFDTTIATAGTYAATLHDFSFPVALTSVTFAAAQTEPWSGAFRGAAAASTSTPRPGRLRFWRSRRPTHRSAAGCSASI